MANIIFSIPEGMTYDNFYDLLRDNGLLNGDEITSDGSHIDMRTSWSLDDLEVEVIDSIIKYYKEEYDLDIKEDIIVYNESGEVQEYGFLKINYAETFCFDGENSYYTNGSYDTCIVPMSILNDENAYFESSKGYQDDNFKNVKDKLIELGFKILDVYWQVLIYSLK